jgi:hypothetical protein
MSVNVNKSRGYHLVGGINFSSPPLGHLTHKRYPVAVYGNVAYLAGSTGSVNNKPVSDN